MENEEQYLAYFKYEGELVEDGYFDARKSAEALIGIDEIFKYFLHKKSPNLSQIDFELPVKIRKGSWETLIPANIGAWLEFIIGTGITTYSITALKKMAENDIGNLGFKDVFKSIIKSVKWIIQIGKHLKSMSHKSFNKFEIKESNNIQFIGIYNNENELLFVPKEYLDIYTEIPEAILGRLTKNIDVGRELKVGFSEKESNDIDDTEKEVSVTIDEKIIFYKEKIPEDVLFPELIHNQYVELKGHITRGNENSNTIGFAYNDHILTCYPIQGKIVTNKKLFFTDCIIRGYVDRMDNENNFIESRPKIRYLDLKPDKKNKSSDIQKLLDEDNQGI